MQPALFEPPAQPKRRRSGTVKPPRPLEKDIKTAIFNALSAHPLVLEVAVVGVSSGGSCARWLSDGMAPLG